MKKSTKGLLAAGTAAVLLTGGAGTLAYWTADTAVNAGTLSSGTITLGAVTCGGWKHTENDATVTKIVPGDTVYNDCPTTLTLVGDHIGATLAIDPASFGSSTLATSLTPTVALRNTATGAPIAAVTSQGTTNVTARVSVTVPYGGPVSTPDPRTGASNGSKDGTAVLNSMNLIAVQTHQAPN